MRVQTAKFNISGQADIVRISRTGHTMESIIVIIKNSTVIREHTNRKISSGRYIKINENRKYKWKNVGEK